MLPKPRPLGSLTLGPLLSFHDSSRFCWPFVCIVQLTASRPFDTDSVVYRPPNLRHLVDRLGAGHVCFGTDYPLPVHADPVGSVVDSLDRAEAAWVREGTASALLSPQ